MTSPKLTPAERIARDEQRLARMKHELAHPDAPRVSSISLPPVPIVEWTDCYDEGWANFITPESFAHPAKAARGLLKKIYDHLFEIGALRKGSVVVDPFGGIGTTAIEGAWRGCHVICCELEPRFVALMEENFALHAPNLHMLGLPVPVVVQGDSRHLRALVQPAIEAVIASPPYSEGLGHGGTPTTGGGKEGAVVLDAMQRGYGTTAGQLESMKTGDVDVVVSSPPYTKEALGHKRGEAGAIREATGQYHQGYTAGEIVKDSYGEEQEGQLGAMPTGDVDVVVSSPPYAESLSPDRGGARHKEGFHQGETQGKQLNVDGYGQTAGQLERLPSGEVDVVLSSPPYAESMTAGNTVPDADHRQKLATEAGYGKIGGGQLSHSNRYSFESDNLGNLPPGKVDVVISSPPYAEIASGAGGLNTKPAHDGQQGGRSPDAASQDTDQKYGDADGQLAKLPKGEVDVVIASPPYADQPMNPGESSRPEAKIARLQAEGNFEDAEKVRQHSSGAASNLRQHEYGETDGQLGDMFPGTIDTVIASPPYATDQFGGGGEKHDKVIDAMKEGYGKTDGQLGGLVEDTVDAIVTSPPYESALSARGGAKGGRQRAQAGIGNAVAGKDDVDRTSGSYGQTDGQMGEMETEGVDAVITSPPYEQQQTGGGIAITGTPEQRIYGMRSPVGYQQQGVSDGQLSKETADTFWSAARDIVRESYAILKPGGYAVWITKRFVRNGEIVPFDNDWRKLCEYCGFETLTEVHAMLVKETHETNLFGEEEVSRLERKSFFRRLSEKKGSPKIDWETIYIMRKRND